MRAVVTRPVEDADRIAAPLRARGVEVFVEPLMAVVTAAAADVQTEGVQAFLLTSANGARALAANLKDHPHALALPTYCVGDQTLRVARDLGFVHLRSADGDVHSLVALVRERVAPAHGALLHAAGSVVAGDLKGLLEDAGYTVRRQPLYETRTAKGFSRAFQELMRDGLVDAILFYSPRTARTFADLASDADLGDACRSVTAYCLSPAVADALGDLPFHRLRVAPDPNQEALLTVFDEDNAHAFARVFSEADSEDAEGDGTMTERPKAGKTGQSGKTPTPEDTAKTDAPTDAAADPAKESAAQGTPAKDDTAAKASGKTDTTKTTKDAKGPKDKDAKAAAPKKDDPPKGATPKAETPKSGATPTTAAATAASSSSAATSSTPKTGTATASPPTSGSPPPRGPSGPSSPSAAPPAGGKGGVSGAVVGVLVLLLLLVGAWATLPIWAKALPPRAQEVVAPLLPGNGAATRVAALQDEASRLAERLAGLSDTVTTLQQRVEDLEARPQAPTPATDANGALSDAARQTLQSLQERVDTLAAAADQPPEGLETLEQDIAALDERLGELQASRAEASTVLNLTDRVARVEEAVRQQEARQAQAVAFLVTVGQLRQAVDTGRPFQDELRSARAVAPQGLDMDAATDGWADRAGQGVPSPTSLRQAFAERSDAILRASVNLDEGNTWWERTADRLLSVVSVRRTDGEAVGDGTAAIVSRAEQDLDSGSLAAAIAEVEKLSGGSAEAAADWLAAARARLAAEEGLAGLTGEALARLQAARSAPGAEAGSGTPETAPAASGQEG